MKVPIAAVRSDELTSLKKRYINTNTNEWVIPIKILAIGNSEKVGYIDMIKYFDLGSKDKAKELLKSLPEDIDGKVIEELCKNYIEDCFDL